MFDIGLWELVIIAVVFLLIMGPERLPSAAKQMAFVIRKTRQSIYRWRSEMQHEINSSPLADIEQARHEMRDLKNDIKQLGSELADLQDQQPEKQKNNE